MHIVNRILDHETSPDVNIWVTLMSGRVKGDGERPHFWAVQSFWYDLQWMRTCNSSIILSNCVIAPSIHRHTAVLLKHLHRTRSYTEVGKNTDIVNQKMEALRRFDNGGAYSSRAMRAEDSGKSSSTLLTGSGLTSLKRDNARACVIPSMSSGLNSISLMITSTIRLFMGNQSVPEPSKWAFMVFTNATSTALKKASWSSPPQRLVYSDHFCACCCLRCWT